MWVEGVAVHDLIYCGLCTAAAAIDKVEPAAAASACHGGYNLACRNSSPFIPSPKKVIFLLRCLVLTLVFMKLGRFFVEEQHLFNYSGGSNTQHSNSQFIWIPNVSNLGLRIVQFSNVFWQNGRHLLGFWMVRISLGFYIKKSSLSIKRPSLELPFSSSVFEWLGSKPNNYGPSEIQTRSIVEPPLYS